MGLEKCCISVLQKRAIPVNLESRIQLTLRLSRPEDMGCSVACVIGTFPAGLELTHLHIAVLVPADVITRLSRRRMNIWQSVLNQFLISPCGDWVHEQQQTGGQPLKWPPQP